MTICESDDGTPLAVLLGGRWQPVSLTRGLWRIDQYWWRGTEIRRVYYQITPPDGPLITVFRDLNTGQWYRQNY
jgi:hypothetical protein